LAAGITIRALPLQSAPVHPCGARFEDANAICLKGAANLPRSHLLKANENYLCHAAALRVHSFLGIPRLSAVLNAARRLPPLQYGVR
jgi:hypothetical protein